MSQAPGLIKHCPTSFSFPEKIQFFEPNPLPADLFFLTNGEREKGKKKGFCWISTYLSQPLSDSSTSALSNRSTSSLATLHLALSSPPSWGRQSNPESKMKALKSRHVQDGILARLHVCLNRSMAVRGKTMTGKGIGWRHDEQDGLMLSQFFVQDLHRMWPHGRQMAGLSTCRLLSI